MKRLLLILLLSPTVQAQPLTTYSNQYGQPIGSSITINNTTYYSNQYGQPIGSSYTPPPPPPPPVYQPPQPQSNPYNIAPYVLPPPGYQPPKVER